MEEFKTASSVRGFHVYQEIWSPFLGEVLTCRKEENPRDRYAVAVICETSGETVGHVPKTISTVCSKFITHGGAIYCKVTGGWQYSRDLPQGGMEIPCILCFTGSAIELNKVWKFFSSFPSILAGIPLVSTVTSTHPTVSSTPTMTSTPPTVSSYPPAVSSHPPAVSSNPSIAIRAPPTVTCMLPTVSNHPLTVTSTTPAVSTATVFHPHFLYLLPPATIPYQKWPSHPQQWPILVPQQVTMLLF